MVPFFVLIDGRHSQPPEHVTRVHPPPRMKVTCPLPCGPPEGVYTGRMKDPTGALPRVDTDANEGPTVAFVAVVPFEQVGDTLVDHGNEWYVPFVQLGRSGTRVKNLAQVVSEVLVLVRFVLLFVRFEPLF